jgi:hypothetical protein
MSKETFVGIDFQKIADAIGRQCEIEREFAGPIAPHGDLIYRGVLLSSRYNVAHEFDHMRAVVDAIPELMARKLNQSSANLTRALITPL